MGFGASRADEHQRQEYNRIRIMPIDSAFDASRHERWRRWKISFRHLLPAVSFIAIPWKCGLAIKSHLYAQFEGLLVLLLFGDSLLFSGANKKRFLWLGGGLWADVDT